MTWNLPLFTPFILNPALNSRAFFYDLFGGVSDKKLQGFWSFTVWLLKNGRGGAQFTEISWLSHWVEWKGNGKDGKLREWKGWESTNGAATFNGSSQIILNSRWSCRLRKASSPCRFSLLDKVLTCSESFKLKKVWKPMS